MKKSSGVDSLLPGEQFLNLSNLFIEQNFPNCIKLKLNEPSSFNLNALAYSDSVILTPLNPTDTFQLKKRISSDVRTLAKLKYPPINLIYLVDGKLNLSDNDVIKFNNNLSKNGFRIHIHTEKRIYESLLLSYKPPPNLQNNLKPYYDLLYNAVQIEESIIEEIFSLLSSDNKYDVDISPFATKLLNLRPKIALNFVDDNYREVLNTYDIFWINKEAVEFFIKNNFHRYEPQLYNLLGKIRNHFRQHPLNHKGIVDFPVNDPKYFDELIPLVLASEKMGDPRYENAAKAIILFFFEYCDFGKKSKEDPQSLFPKFENEI